MIDLHIIHAITNGIKFYQDNIANFRTTFDDVSQNYADRLHAKLVEMNVQFDTSNNRKHSVFPLITTGLSEKTQASNQTLSNFSAQGKLGLYLSQECKITIYTNDLDEIRILHRIIQSSLLVFKKSFLEMGYLTLDFEKSKDLEPADESIGGRVDKLLVIGDGVVVYRRELTYSALRQLLAEPIGSVETFSTWDLTPEINNDI